MVKVIIEQDGKRKELTGDLAICAVAKFGEKETGVDAFIKGEGNVGRVVDILLNTIPRILDAVSKSKADYIYAMMTLNKELDKKIKSELKESADTIAETLKAL